MSRGRGKGTVESSADNPGFSSRGPWWVKARFPAPPAKKSSSYLCTKSPITDPRQGCLPSNSEASSPESSSPWHPFPTFRGAWCCIEDPGTQWEALDQRRQGREAPSPFPGNVQEGRAAVLRAQPHNDRKPFTFSKNTGPKVRRLQLLLLCQPNLRKRGQKV